MYKTCINQFLNFLNLFLTYFFVDSLGISHNAPQFHSSSSLSYLPLIPEVSPSKENFKKFKSKASKQTKGEKTLPLPLLSCLSNTSSFILVALGALVCHTVHLFVQSVLLLNVHCKKSLVFKVSGFWYFIITRPSPKLLSEFLRLAQVMKTLRVSFHRSSPFTSSSRAKMR